MSHVKHDKEGKQQQRTNKNNNDNKKYIAIHMSIWELHKKYNLTV